MKQKQFTSLRSSTQEEYGQVQTLCDIIKAVNEEKHFKSTQEVFDGIAPIMNRYIKRGTIGELTRQHIKAGLLDDESLFRDGQLDCDALREKLIESITTDKDDKYERIMAQRDVFKFVGLLMYFNCFRKYTSVEQIREDFCQQLFDEEMPDGDLSKSYLNDKLFFCVPIGGYAYPYFSFFWALDSLWDYVCDENGVLDNKKLQNKMIDEYQTCKKEMGLEAMVDAHYSDDGPCHPEVYFPNTEEFYGPVLVAVESERKFIESCGEGKGPNRYPYGYEHALLQRILSKKIRKIFFGHRTQLGLKVIAKDKTSSMTEYKLFGRNILIKRMGCGNGDSVGSPIPPSLNLFVKVTNGCNANCPFCSNAGHTQDRHIFDVDKLFACIDEILNQRIILNRLNITGGEPSIVPETVNRIIERLNASPKYQRIHLHLNTNGLLPKSQEMMRIARFDSISISMHHYDVSVLSKIYNCHIPSSAIDFEGIDLDKLNLSCNLIKGYIDSPEEARKMLDKTIDIGIPRIGFVSLMPVNKYSKEHFIDLEEIRIESIPHVYFTKSKNRGGNCKCSNYLYNRDGKILEIYMRNYMNPNYCESSVVFDGQHLRQGFHDNNIIY